MITRDKLREHLANIEQLDYLRFGDLTVKHPKTFEEIPLIEGDYVEIQLVQFCLQCVRDELTTYGETTANFILACSRCDTTLRSCAEEVEKYTSWTVDRIKKDFITTLFKNAGIYPDKNGSRN